MSDDNALIGRKTELAQLEQVFRGLREGRGRVVFLSGTVGVGKTSLAREFIRRIGRMEAGAALVAASCVEGQTRYRAYGPFRDALAQLGELDPSFRKLVRRDAPAWLGIQSASSRHGLFDQCLEVWRGIVHDRPAVLLIDDWQWSDRSSLDLMVRLGNEFSAIPLLCLLTVDTTADEDPPPLRNLRRRLGANILELTLRPLEPKEVAEVVSHELGGNADTELTEWVGQGSAGNPFHALQLVRLLRERDAIRRRLFRYTLREEALPDPGLKLDEIVTRRLDALDPNVRWTLEAAALAGSIVDSAVVAGQVGRDEAEVVSQLRESTRRYDLIEGGVEHEWAAGKRSVRFQFAHPRIRHLLRVRVAKKRADRLIYRAAEMLETLAGPGATGLADELAVFYLEADADTACHVWSLRAADLAERLYAPYEAETFLRAAARTASDEAKRVQIEFRLATLYAGTGRELEAEKLLEGVFERSREMDDRATEVRAGTLLGSLQLERGVQPARVSALSGHLVDSARQSGNATELVAALDLASAVAERIGRAEDAFLMAEEGFHVAEGSEDRELVAQAAHRLARIHVSFGSPEEGRELAQRAMDIFDDMDTPGSVAECHHLLGLADFRAGEWDGAMRHWTAALQTLETAAVPEQLIAARADIAELATLRGDFDRARDLFESGLELAEKLDDMALVLRCRAGIARLEFERGDYHTTLELTERIREVLPEGGAWREDFQTTAIRALSFLELGDELQAWQEAARLEQLYRGKEGWFERRAEGDAVRVRVIDLDSDSWLAGMVAQQGIGESADTDPYGEGFLQYHRACVQARTSAAEARKSAERAAELFSALGAVPMLERVERLLSELPAAEPPVEAEKGQDITDDKIDRFFDSLEG